LRARQNAGCEQKNCRKNLLEQAVSPQNSRLLEADQSRRHGR
jgi:hypothetical protein